ncbi:hypothetical protein [Pseudomonas sp. LRF_L74]|uniref:hypothetical protein n=1 Tax=Pseudomonas sp. LRF_L74 TaxID=3369422 RepID=UPI003F6393DD
MQALAQWSRHRIDEQAQTVIPNVHAMVVGHTTVRRPVVLGNVYHIDTGGWLEHGYFTLLNLTTLEAIPPIPAKLDWEAA